MAERAGVDLSPGATWALVRIDEHGFAGARAMAERAGRRRGADRRRRPSSCASAAWSPARTARRRSTPAGHEVTGRVVTARRELLAERLADEAADRPPEVEALLVRLSVELVGERP